MGRAARCVWRCRDPDDFRICAQFEKHHHRQAGDHAPRYRAANRLNRRKYFSGRTFTGTAFLSAAGCRLGAISHPDSKTVHVRLGHASRRRRDGRAGAPGRARNPERNRERKTLNVAAAREVLILGGGHNALVTAFYLAKKGLKPLVLERRAVVGGAAVTEEFHPGFRCSTVAHAAGPLLPSILRDMQLAKHGLDMLESPVRVFAPSPNGRALVLATDPHAAARQIESFSKKDAAKYIELHRALVRTAAILSELLTLTPPVIEKPSNEDLWKLLKVGRKFRGLGKKEMMRLIRWGPMAAADFVAEFFETDLLRAAIAARGIFGAAMGPWSAGSTTLLLLRAGADPYPVGNSAIPRGGMGALTAAMAASAKSVGAEIRTNADVQKILVKNGAVIGVVLSSGEEIAAKCVVSGADPRRTLLGLLDPVHLPPSFVVKMLNFRSNGVAAKVNVALDALPSFTALNQSSGDTSALSGRIHIGPGIDYL